MTIHALPRRLPAYDEPVVDVEERFTPAVNPEHPTPEGCERLVIAQSSMSLLHGMSDGWDEVPIALTLVDNLGEAIEIGPWSLGLIEAQTLADKLIELVELSRELVKWDSPEAEPTQIGGRNG